MKFDTKMNSVFHFHSRKNTFIYVTVIVQKLKRSIYYTISELTLPLTEVNTCGNLFYLKGKVMG